MYLSSPLVSVDWLNRNFEIENLIILDATIPKVMNSKADSVDELIPKSIFFDTKKTFSDISSEFPNTLPSIQQFEEEAQNLGINSNSIIIIYDQHGMYSSARAWCLFRHFGHNNVAVLDGGLPEWKQKGYKMVSQYCHQHPHGNFKANTSNELFTNFDGITQFSVDNNVLIFDARSNERFTGKVPEPRKGLRSGSIPNSVNLPYTTLLDGNTMKTSEELAAIFNTFVAHQKQLVFSCGSGITACNLALAAGLVGFENITVYDGSWTEYATLTA